MTATLNIQTIDANHDDLRSAIGDLRRRLSPQGNIVSQAGRQRTIDVFGAPLTPVEVVERICHDVRNRGLDAVLDYTAKLDGAKLTPETLRVSADELQAAYQAAPPGLLETIAKVADNIRTFQRAILHGDVRVPTIEGGYLRQRYLPLDRVGVCVPGGAAAYPSTALMTVVPAQVAGVREIAVVAPPTKFGSYSPVLLATCHALGVTEVYRMGGAQAIAALAYGVSGVPQVDKIVGPGNLFVALAKKCVYGDVDIDSIAGPSEVVLVADKSTPPAFAAADLIAQAEHAPGASILITWEPELIPAIRAELEQQLAQLERGQLARQSLEDFGALILVRDQDQATALADEIAPEHLHLAVNNAAEMLEQIRHAGAAFIGQWSPVSVGDYAAGPSHVLPTGGTARFASGLCANDFLRRTSVIHYTPADLICAAPLVQKLADLEGLTAHRASVDVRLVAAKAARNGKKPTQ
ncbi:MAG: histidinol dehydrogenase [Planctomycetes bacterium]|nr:histidinol dehydrogenase [Planctomycetota bacterium]